MISTFNKLFIQKLQDLLQCWADMQVVPVIYNSNVYMISLKHFNINSLNYSYYSARHRAHVTMCTIMSSLMGKLGLSKAYEFHILLIHFTFKNNFRLVSIWVCLHCGRKCKNYYGFQFISKSVLYTNYETKQSIQFLWICFLLELGIHAMVLVTHTVKYIAAIATVLCLLLISCLS